MPHHFPARDSVVHEIFPASHCAQATVFALFIREFCLLRISATDVAGSIGRHPHPDPNGLLPSCPASTPCWRYSSSLFLSSLCRFSSVLVCSKYPFCRAPLLEECPQHHGHKGDPGVTPGTCGTIGERAQVILV